MKKQYDAPHILVLQTQEDVVRTSGLFDAKTGDTMYDYKNLFGF